jgi:hypothetical protein
MKTAVPAPWNVLGIYEHSITDVRVGAPNVIGKIVSSGLEAAMDHEPFNRDDVFSGGAPAVASSEALDILRKFKSNTARLESVRGSKRVPTLSIHG